MQRQSEKKDRFLRTNNASHELSLATTVRKAASYMTGVIAMAAMLQGCDSPDDDFANHQVPQTTGAQQTTEVQQEKSAEETKAATRSEASSPEKSSSRKVIERRLDPSIRLPGSAANSHDEEKVEKKNLNLAYSAGNASIGGEYAANGQSERHDNKLPNMFGSQALGTKVGGGVIRDEENENYMDSIQGAEVNVEFSID